MTARAIIRKQLYAGEGFSQRQKQAFTKLSANTAAKPRRSFGAGSASVPAVGTSAPGSQQNCLPERPGRHGKITSQNPWWAWAGFQLGSGVRRSFYVPSRKQEGFDEASTYLRESKTSGICNTPSTQLRRSFDVASTQVSRRVGRRLRRRALRRLCRIDS